MKTCAWFERVEAYIDGETPSGEALETHLAQCPQCQAHAAAIQKMRRGIDTVIAAYPEISEAQFPHFMNGIRDAIDQPRRRFMGWWAAASLTAAAMIVALATFSIIYGGPEPVRATEVESVSTDLEGATVDWYDTKEGVTTVWVNVAKEDIE